MSLGRIAGEETRPRQRPSHKSRFQKKSWKRFWRRSCPLLPPFACPLLQGYRTSLDEHYISETRRILDQPHPEVPEGIAAAAADAPEEDSGNETEVEWGGSLTSYSYSSYEVCEIPDLETARQEAEWLEQRRLQAPPLYAAGVAGSTARSSADSKGPAVEAELNKALDLCDQIQEALSQSKQHLSMHIGTLSTYQSAREVVVSYLQAKQVWRPSAAYAGSIARTDAMDISLVGDGKGKGKGKDGKGKDNKKGKGKEAKGKGKDSHSNKGGKGQQEKDCCTICWKTGHATEKCWFNSKGQPKGKGKKGVAGITEDNTSVVSAGPSASQVGGQSIITLPSTTTSNKGKNVGMIAKHRLLRLLMVKATSSGQHRHVSPKAILAIPEASTFTGNAILAKESL